MRRVVEIAAPWREPLEALSALAEAPWTLGLLSGGGGPRGRWSYVAAHPVRTLAIDGGAACDPFAELDALLCDGEMLAHGPPFQGGVAGLATYELGAWAQGLPLAPHPDWPPLACAVYPAVLAFDHERRQLRAIGRGETAAEAAARAEALLREAHDPTSPSARRALMSGPLEASDPHAYEAAVAEVIDRIAAGEIFQANIARAWRGRLAPDAAPIDLMRALAARSAAPFAAYLRLPGAALVSNSPERFIAVRQAAGGLAVETRPIKGTRPRGAGATEDARLAAELAASAKDRAENLMIVDLMRNDLARVCVPGSVRAPELFAVESFANVHHLVSTVTGRLAAGQGAAELLRATFPPGSITGAPKIQAMKVIAGLEPPRGPYCGSIFWAGVDGAFDSSVLIRTAALTAEAGGWRLEARAGAGVVADSEPAAERAETEAKIAALRQALEGATPAAVP